MDVRDVHRYDRHERHPLGVVEESEHEPLWRSHLNGANPQELGLILLSAEPVAIKALRVTVNRAQAPARLEIAAARQGNVHTLGNVDAISRYFSAEWASCCEALVWKTRTDPYREIETRSVRLDISDCSFVKLVVHAPHDSVRNSFLEVELDDVELIGLTGSEIRGSQKLDSSLSSDVGDDVTPDHNFDHSRRPLLVFTDSDSDELQSVLLEAGVPMSLVVQVTAIKDTEVAVPSPPLEGCKSISIPDEVVPESTSQDYKLPSVTEDGSITSTLVIPSQVTHGDSNQKRQLVTPFDQILRQYTGQTAQERAMLEKLISGEICISTSGIEKWQSPTISTKDPSNANEITLHTFGEFFTQCLLCGGSDTQVMCVQTVERFARLLKNTIGTTCAFEGIVALIIIGIREAKSSSVFRAAVHLAHTAFLTKMKSAQKEVLDSQYVSSKDGNSPDQNDYPASSPNKPSLELIEGVQLTSLNYSLRIILESTLASPLCWVSTSYISKSPCQLNVNCRKFSRYLWKDPPSIDRAFLQFIRLLVEQDLTHASFFEELLDLNSTDSPSGTKLTTNRLRLLRLILRNDMMFQCQISTNTKIRIRAFCSRWLAANSCSPCVLGDTRCDDSDGGMVRLASECLDEIDKSTCKFSTKLRIRQRLIRLDSVQRNLESSSIPNSHHSHFYHHAAIFVQDPLTEAETSMFVEQMQQYYSTHPRPNALYRHAFVRADPAKGQMAEQAVLEKGNISFQGQVATRKPPKSTFHEEIERKMAPFVFDVDIPSKKAISTTPSQLLPPREVVSTFSSFRGTIEQRSDLPKRTSKVSPEYHLQASNTTKVLATTSKQQGSTLGSIAINALPKTTASPVTAKSPVQNAKDSNPVVNYKTSEQSPSVASPPDNSSELTPASVEQVSQQGEDSKQLATDGPSDQNKGQGKAKGKEKHNGRGKSNAKDADKCILQ